MSIHNLDAFINGIWDWAILDGCFGATKIRPTDIDGLVERNGWFLLLEAKGPGKALSRGQRRTLEQLQKTGLFTVIVVWGNPGKPEQLLILTRHGETMVSRADAEKLRTVVRQWFVFANTTRHSSQTRDAA